MIYVTPKSGELLAVGPGVPDADHSGITAEVFSKVQVRFIFISPQLSHIPPQRRCCHRQSRRTAYNCSPSPRSRTMISSHTAARSHSLPF